MDLHRFTMANGLRVIVAPTHSSAPAALQIWFRGGSRVEADDEMHIAHLFEHLFFRGGRDFADCRSVEREMRLLGGIGNAMTSDEYMCVFVVTSPRHIRQAMHLVSDMALYARCDPDDFEKERAAVIQELKTILDDPEEFAAHKFREVLFGGHALGRVHCERFDILKRLEPRNALRYKERFCVARNALITVVGGIEPLETAKLVEKFFADLPAVEAAVWPPFTADRFLPPAKLIRRRKVEQAHLYVGGLSPSASSPDFRVSSLLHEILSHRLWLRIRVDEALAYRAFADAGSLSDVGYGLVYAGVEPSENAVAKTMCIVFAEMADIKSGSVSSEEFEEAKAVLHAQLDVGLEGISRIGRFLAILELFCGGIKLPEDIHVEIDRIVKDDLTRVARLIWREEAVRSLLLSSVFPRFEEKYCKLRKILR